METFQHPPKLPAESKKRCAAILWDLHLRGPVEDPDGAAIGKFADRLAEIGWDMPQATIIRIVNGLGDRGGQYGDMYPYNYISREINGKRTLRISLIVNPDEVPFPPNPFQSRPAFHPVPTHKGANKGKRERFADPGPTETEGETFARHRQFDDVTAPIEPPALVKAEPEPEPEPMGETDTITTIGTLEPFVVERAAGTNGDQDDFGLADLPGDLLTDLDDEPPRTAMDMVSAAIGLLSDAMAAHAGEQVHLAGDMLDRHIDARLGEYRVLQERLEQTEGKLRHTVAQYEKVVEIARTQRKQLIALQKEVARSRPKSPTTV
jgi:hypothetical protein